MSENNNNENKSDSVPSFKVATLNLNASPIDLQQRLDNLLVWLDHINPDVFLFQEVAEGTTESWIPHLKNFFPYLHMPGAKTSASGIASKFEFIDTGMLPLPIARRDWVAASRATWASFLSPCGHTTYAISAHLAWGSNNEYIRTRQVSTIEKWSKEKAGDNALNNGPKVILGGDMNVEPNNYSLRWLRGEEYFPETKTSTRWTDCWDNAYKKPDTKGYTSSPENKYALITAREYAKIPHPEFLPKRRIDYIFVRGYAFGSQGTPLAAGLWGTEESPKLNLISDHYGVWADLLDVPKENLL